jgi:protocatechuate 3,4-dioxygenase beta subunit
MTAPKLDRRQALAAFGSVGLGALLAACGEDGGGARSVPTTDGGTATVEPQRTASPESAARFGDSSSCTLTPETTEGPYYFDVDSIRGDIRDDREGTTLKLAVRVRDAESCEPIRNAVVDIWHCDAEGAYSGFQSESRTFLRGAQVTDGEGVVEFTTIYPGWYPGRTVHVHAKVHLDRTTVLTTQLFFDDAVSAEVYERAPYSNRGERTDVNTGDGIFDERLLLDLTREGDAVAGAISIDVARA